MISRRRQRDLLAKAEEIKHTSNYPFTPPLKFGAALLAKSGKIYIGTNIFVTPSDLGTHSERLAFYNAIMNGETKFEAIAIATVHPEVLLPCGGCRQLMASFCVDYAESFQIIMGNNKGKIEEVYTLEELLPMPFTRPTKERER